MNSKLASCLATSVLKALRLSRKAIDVATRIRARYAIPPGCKAPTSETAMTLPTTR